jgi:predicted HicB family RNase H-like nuclease
LHGEVINIKDVITFQAKSVDELAAFKDSTDDYLEFCAERGEKPDKPFSGKVMLRCHRSSIG